MPDEPPPDLGQGFAHEDPDRDLGALYFAAAEEAADAIGAIKAVRDAAGAHVGDEILYLNAAIRRRWLGDIPLDACVGRDPYELIPGLGRFRELSRIVVATRAPHRSIVELPSPRGLPRYLDQRLTPWRDGFLFHTRGVTAEHEPQVAGTADERSGTTLLRDALGALGDVVNVVQAVRDADGGLVDERIVFANPAWRREFLGSDELDPTGRLMSEVAPMLGSRFAVRRAVMETGEPSRATFRSPATGRWSDVVIVRFGDGAIIVARDVDAEHLAQEALAASERELAEAQRIAHVGSWRLDPVTGEVAWSDEMWRIYGLEQAGPSPTFAEQARFYDPEGLALVNEAVSDAMATGTPRNLELDINRDDGTVRRVQARIEAVVDGSDEIVSLRGTAADVTEARQAQVRLDQAIRAEMVGRLAGGIAHDFNNVLTAISGYADLLADTMTPEDPRLDDIGAIRDGAARATTLTRQLLAFGRRQALSEVVLVPQVVVEDLVPMLRRLVPTSVLIRAETDGSGGRVRVDRTQLEQALVNLVVNARDAMPDGGSITIITGAVTVAVGDPRLSPLAPAGEHVRITVKDTGTGIDPDALPHLFEPFFTTKGPGHGSGLGLSSVDGFVTQSHGFVTVDSTPGVGTALAIHLPCVSAEHALAASLSPGRASAAVPHDPAAEGGSEQILLVEDEPGVRTMTGRMLRDMGYTVVEARDPGVALAIADASPDAFDILVTDIVMPGMSGMELAGILTARWPELVVLFVSAYAPDATTDERLAQPGRGLLVKPFHRADLAARVRALLDGARAD
jgi:two-component system cell cycle sensor histidine kinase/response regulator CckA